MKKLSFILLLVTIMIAVGCQKEEDGYVLSKIKKGNHRSYFGVPDRVEDSFTIHFCINDSYNLGDVDQLDWSKIGGFYSGKPTDNSLRLGWRYNTKTDLIELGVYAHVDGKTIKSDKEFPVIGYCTVGEYNSVHINITDNAWELIYEGESYVISHNCKGNYHRCYFYFGGNKAAPNDISCWMKFSDNHNNEAT